MSLVKIYRLETKTGTGIYQSIGSEAVQYCTASFLQSLRGLKKENYEEYQIEDFYQLSLSRHRNIFEDGFVGKLNKSKKKIIDFYCGFTSLEQLLDWFPIEGLINFLNYDIFVNVYQVEKDFMFSSEIQCMFSKQQATLICSKTIEEFINENI